ncbi:GntR family transcriptional regulator / MocR family aminotransferase [Cohnella sp. OV330]|uniref:aminotransferase-like domain-containing protein n=1 Tax=Cohnella sp. OV330 TaxID=1855288 RepID=UPI0008EA80CD|nr:PLP-dependent aminotransferase family protein [Cohnella sp. OV330]SFA93840.1 GntR family transcriptional regulator / MocR family aminotransferase [Cohnella sp. OV330]
MSIQVPYDVRLSACGVKHLALYQAIRDSIVAGKLPPGVKLPSTRTLAESYGLSRGSVSIAYEMLAAEGYVRASVGRGTYVAGADARPAEAARNRGNGAATEPPTHAKTHGADDEPVAGLSGSSALGLSGWGLRLVREVRSDVSSPEGTQAQRTPLQGTHQEATSNAAAQLASLQQGAGKVSSLSADSVSDSKPFEAISFKPRGMGERWFPWMSWKAAVSAEWRRRGPAPAEDGGAAAGSAELRRAIAGRLRRERGILCEAEDIVVTGGSMQAIALLAQLLLEPGKSAVAEDPCYSGTQRAIRASGAALIAAPVDRQGIVPDDWPAELLFVTPTRQFPTGAVLTYERRMALLDWAAKRGAWIVEDDYDSEFRWSGRPIEPLKSLDRQERVVYVGSFSRAMRQEVRIGYAVLPPALREPFLLAKQLYDPYPAGLTEQRALADWMNQGEYDRHLRRTRRIFNRLQGLLREELSKLEPLFEVHPADAGLLLFATWTDSPERYDRFALACRQAGACWGDGMIYAAAQRPDERTALFGFAHLDEDGIATGMRRVRETAARLGLTEEPRQYESAVHKYAARNGGAGDA